MDTPGASTSSQPPSVFLPRLPRTNHTLTPCSATNIGGHVLRLRELLLPLVPSVDGVGYEEKTTTTSTTGKVKASATPNKLRRLSAASQENAVTRDRRPSSSSVASSSTSASKRSSSSRRHSLVRPRSTSSASAISATSSSAGSSTMGDASIVVMDEFEREWSENWLSSVVRRGEGWMADVEAEMNELGQEGSEEMQALEEEHAAREKVLEDASAVIAMLAGCSAVGGITRELSFQLRLPLSGSNSDAMEDELDRELVVRTHDAALSDHLSVGVQTWASSVLLGRIFAQEPEKYLGAPPPSTGRKRPRVLDLGAGTGVMSILPRAILDELIEQQEGGERDEDWDQGLVIATDYHPDVLANLKTCVDLNFPPTTASAEDDENSGDVYPTHHSGIRILSLDWSTFPDLAEAVHRGKGATLSAGSQLKHEQDPAAAAIDAANIWQLSASTSGPAPIDGDASTSSTSLDADLAQPFDIVLVVDCVYDLAHAAMIRRCLQWLVRPPVVDDKGEVVVEGGVAHLLSPLRPTYAAETATILAAFPFADTLPPRSARRKPSQASASLRDTPTTSASPSPHLQAAVTTSSSVSTLSLGPVDGSKAPSSHLGSGVATPTSAGSSNSTPGTATPLGGLHRSLERLVIDPRELKKQDARSSPSLARPEMIAGCGLGEKDGWTLATKSRESVEKAEGYGRADEREYWWWQIGWA